MLLKRWEPIAGMRRLDGDFDRMFRHAFRPYHLRPIFRNGHSPWRLTYIRTPTA